MIVSRLLCLALIAILIWPPMTGSQPAALRTFTDAPATRAAPHAPETLDVNQGHDPGRVAKRKSRDRRDRETRRARNNERKPPSGAEGMLAPEVLATASSDDCGPGLVPVGDTGRCTHGPDPAPPGVSRDLVAEQPSAREVDQATAGIACEGDGKSGYRVQVIYAYDGSRTSRYNQEVGRIRIAAAGADDLMRESSLAAGQEMHFLFVHDAQCNIDVQPVGFSTDAMESFGTMIQTMSTGAQGRTDRIYLIFADTTSAGICGIGTIMPDDRDSPVNENNRGPSYSRVDYRCWTPQTALHELMHNLGGVQDGAPMGNGGGHCIDEWDVLCYKDSPSSPEMQYVCTDRSTFQHRVDCNFDTYFNPLPAPGAYLDTHWNTADSVFLETGAGTCPAEASGCRGALSLSTSHTSVKRNKRVRVSATLSNTTARNATITLRACRGGSCSGSAGQTIATLSRSSPSTEWKATGQGRVTFVAQVTSGSGVMTSNPVTVSIKKEKKKRKH